MIFRAQFLGQQLHFFHVWIPFDLLARPQGRSLAAVPVELNLDVPVRIGKGAQKLQNFQN